MPRHESDKPSREEIADLERWCEADAWRRVWNTVVAIRHAPDPRAELERIRPLVTHPEVELGRLPILLVATVDAIVAQRAAPGPRSI